MNDDNRAEFLRFIDEIIERIVKAKDDTGTILLELCGMNRHITTFRFLRMYYQIPSRKIPNLTQKLAKLNPEQRRKLLRDTLEALQKE